ncbi:hypothetical protein [Flavobacterium sp.]|uniref:hypothetical protein n=1 Tax=Flavobacterium sp. TaxID=239 RepID=UPI00120F02B4|nr:hypothetical protein [Flavobacterium sp.]RZJ70292.1 MAG: hypothetical protein EOO49_14270 [Flavobacterium sp.]
MATQIFDVQWNDAPAGKPILSKAEIVAYCRHFGQDTQELHDFLTRFDFDEWICMELFVDYVYGKVDKSGEVGSDAVQYLNIVSGTFFSDEAELALKNYLGFDKKKFDYLYEDSPPFVTFPDCPLWIVQVTGKQKQQSSGIFFMPATFWKDARMTSESYADEYFGVKERYNKWYGEPFGKNHDQSQYWRNRIGHFSPNFIRRDNGLEIAFDYHNIHVDNFANRLFVHDSEKDEMAFYDLADASKKLAAPNFLKDSRNGFMQLSSDGYRFYSDTKLVTTDKDFNVISESASKIVNSFEDDFWKVIIDKKGVLMTKKQSGEEKRLKFSELKLTSFSKDPDSVKIFANGNNSVIFFEYKAAIVDSSFNVTNLAFDSIFKKEIQPYFCGYYQKRETLSVSPDRHLFFGNEGVFEIGKDEKPKMFTEKLRAITGEGLFYNAIKDEALQGIWFLAGNDRLVFTDENFEKGYVFNFTQQDLSHEHYNSYRYSNIFFDKDQNLWYSLLGSTLHKITRSELESKLKTAISFSDQAKSLVK